MAETEATPGLPESSSMSVFLTGAGGGIGREITRRLVAAGHRVTGTVRSSDEAQAYRLDGGLPAFPDLTRAGELRSAMRAVDANIVVHAVTQRPNHVPFINGRWEDYTDAVDQGTAAIMEAAQAAEAKFVVYLSYAFLGGTIGGGHGDEAPTPVSESDNAFIQAALRAEQHVLHGPVPGCVLRVGYVYGARSPETVALRDQLKGMGPLPLGDEHAYAAWTHLDDLADAVLLALLQQPAGQIMHVVDSQPATPAEFVGYFAESLHLTPPSPAPGFLSGLVGGRTQNLLLNISTRASNADATEALGWTPRYRTYREGIDQTLLVLRAEEPIR